MLFIAQSVAPLDWHLVLAVLAGASLAAFAMTHVRGALMAPPLGVSSAFVAVGSAGIARPDAKRFAETLRRAIHDLAEPADLSLPRGSQPSTAPGEATAMAKRPVTAPVQTAKAAGSQTVAGLRARQAAGGHAASLDRGVARRDPALSVSMQVDRLNSIVTAAVDQAGQAMVLHRAAGQQIDSADYALQNLFAELSAVMPDVQRTPQRPPVAERR